MSRREKARAATYVAKAVVDSIERSAIRSGCQTAFCATSSDPDPRPRIIARGI